MVRHGPRYHHKIYILFIVNNNKQKYKASHQLFLEAEKNKGCNFIQDI